MTIQNGRPGNDPRPQTPPACPPPIDPSPVALGAHLPPNLRAKVRFRSDEAAIYLEAIHGVTVAVRTLDKLRSTGGGPEFQKFNRSALYHRDALDTWALAKLGKSLRSTSELEG